MTLPGISHRRTVPRSFTITPSCLVLLMLVSALFGAAATWGITRDRGVPQVVRGTVIAVNMHVTAIAFRPDGPAGSHIFERCNESMILTTDLHWTDTDGTPPGGNRPTCLQPGSYGQRVELGIVDLHLGDYRGPIPSKVVISVRCLNP